MNPNSNPIQPATDGVTPPSVSVTPVSPAPSGVPQVAPGPAPIVTPVPQPLPVQPASVPAYAVPTGQSYGVGEDAGKTLGIVGLILAFFIAPVGLILSIVGVVKSKNSGHTNVPAILGIIFSVIIGIIGTVVILGAIGLYQICEQYGPGTHYIDGAAYTCEQ